MSHDNAKILRDGLKKGLKMIEDALFLSLWESAVALLKDVGARHDRGEQGWHGFTGNTQLSYMCGIYIGGKLEGVVNQDNWHKPPVRKKISGRTYLRHPYEGSQRGLPTKRWEVIPTDGDYGYNTSLNFLRGYRARRNSICLVMTTGTEYSEYIETVQKLDVLTNTFNNAAEIIRRNWKPIPT